MIGFEILFMYFIIYSFLGWLCESIYCSVTQSKIINSGFMYGPYCPIYGFGGLLVVIFLTPFFNFPIVVFLLGMLMTTALEYITSYLMEKAFNAKWWDYSHMKLNINGRVCLLFGIFFGIMGLFATYVIHPYVQDLINMIPLNYLNIIVICIFILIIIDFNSTLYTVLSLEKKLLQIKEIAEKIKDEKINQFNNSELIKQLEELKSNTILKGNNYYKRILEAFPSLDFKKFSNQINELKLELHKKQFLKKQKNKNKKDIKRLSD